MLSPVRCAGRDAVNELVEDGLIELVSVDEEGIASYRSRCKFTANPNLECD
jgi:hypothetical protein